MKTINQDNWTESCLQKEKDILFISLMADIPSEDNPQDIPLFYQVSLGDENFRSSQEWTFKKLSEAINFTCSERFSGWKLISRNDLGHLEEDKCSSCSSH